MSNNEIKKKEILDSILTTFLSGKTFPERQKFRAKFIKDRQLIEELVDEDYINKNEYEIYSLRLSALSYLQNHNAKWVLANINKLIPVFQETLYARAFRQTLASRADS